MAFGNELGVRCLHRLSLIIPPPGRRAPAHHGRAAVSIRRQRRLIPASRRAHRQGRGDTLMSARGARGAGGALSGQGLRGRWLLAGTSLRAPTLSRPPCFLVEKARIWARRDRPPRHVHPSRQDATGTVGSRGESRPQAVAGPPLNTRAAKIGDAPGDCHCRDRCYLKLVGVLRQDAATSFQPSLRSASSTRRPEQEASRVVASAAPGYRCQSDHGKPRSWVTRLPGIW